MVMLVARHNISTGGKGERKLIKAKQQFDPADFPGVTQDEWNAMLKNGNVFRPTDVSYASPSAERAPVVEGRSPRTDLESQKPASSAAAEEDDDDEDEDDDPPVKTRRGRAAKTEDDDDI